MKMAFERERHVQHFPLCGAQFICVITFLLLNSGFSLCTESKANIYKIPLGVIFEPGSTQIQSAFKYAIQNSNQVAAKMSNKFELQPMVHVIDSSDSFNLSKIISNYFVHGIPILVGSNDESYGTVQTNPYSHKTPFIATGFPKYVTSCIRNKDIKVSKSFNFVTSLRPDYYRAVIDIIEYYGWKNIIYLYYSHEGFMRLQSIFQALPETGDSFHVDIVRQISSAEEAVNILLQIEIIDRFRQKYVVLDCPAFLAHKAMDVPWELSFSDYGTVNVTGFRIVDTTKPFVRNFLQGWTQLDSTNFPGAGSNLISANAALLYDAVVVFIEAISRMCSSTMIYGHYGAIAVNDTSCSRLLRRNGENFVKILKQVEIQGLSGQIRFTPEGHRHNYTIDVMEMTTHSSKVKIGEWSDTKGFTAIPAKYTRPTTFPQIAKNPTYIVTTILGEPYVMLRVPENAEILTGNDRFTGFCKDIADVIAEKLGIKYEFRLVKDHRYGKLDKDGKWDGMVGELVRREADIAIASLTITHDREQAVDFSKPFMSVGISIMVYRPPDRHPSLLTFMTPLSTEIWLCVLLSYIAVIIVLFVVSRFNPNERTMGSNTLVSISNDPIWFSLAALVQQSSNISPRSLAGRMVAGFWWFFVLILISSYTANFAAVRTVNRMHTPITSVKDLAAQTDVEYGTVYGGSTWNFFRRAQGRTYARMWDFMNSRPHVFVPNADEGVQRVRERKGRYAYLIESSNNDYTNGRLPCNTMKVGRNLDTKGFGVATPKGSPLKHQINLAVLNMRDTGILYQLQNKWWRDRSECPPLNISNSDALEHGELSFDSLAGIFFILLLGLALALIVAALGVCYKSQTRILH